MDREDLERFEANRKWFNAFFEDIYQLFRRIAKQQSDAFNAGKAGYYYPKYNDYPIIPRYTMMGQPAANYALQVYAVFDARQIKLTNYLTPEASFVIVRHSRPKSFLSDDNYGKKIFRNDGISIEKLNSIAFAGILPNGIEYQAFQIPFLAFKPGVDVHLAIENEIINVLKHLPDFNSQR